MDSAFCSRKKFPRQQIQIAVLL